MVRENNDVSLKKLINIINMKKVFLFLLQLLIAILILLPVFAMNLMMDANEPVVKGLIKCVLVIMSIDVVLVVLNKYARESPYVYISLFICTMSTCLMYYRLYIVSENTELKSKVALYENYYKAAEEVLDQITDIDDPIWSTDIGAKYLEYDYAVNERLQDTTH